ncbi:MAG: hypothetical protein WCO04_14990 [Pseudomonadota bacterium]
MFIRPALRRLRTQLVAVLLDQLAGAKTRPPVAGFLIWQAFTVLSAGRRYDGGFALPFTLGEVALFEVRHGARFGPDHLAILMAMDAAWLDHVRTPAKEEQPPLTVSVFDAAFA